MNIEQFEQDCREYEEAFDKMKTEYQLPNRWFAQPDHLAIKCADEIDYATTVHEWMPHADGDGLWEIGLDGRYIASGRLVSSLVVATFEFSWLEIMQPRSGRETDTGHVEHTEFTIDDFEVVWNGLIGRGVPGVKIQKKPGHHWINVPIGEKREIKFNNLSLEKVTEKERLQHKLHKITL